MGGCTLAHIYQSGRPGCRVKAWNPHRGDRVFLFICFHHIRNIYSIHMGHLIDSFLARGLKFTDLFWIGVIGVAIFFFASLIGRFIWSIGEEYPEEESDTWEDEPWI